MIKVNLKTPLLNVKGEPKENVFLSDIIADLLSSEVKGNALKLFGWMQDLSKDGSLNLDNADYTTLKTLIEGTERMPVLVKGQVLIVLNEAKNN
jgi:hypothetical protein